jgi:small subunit ribosomal protein S6
MPLPAPTYDLILMLDTQSDAPARAKIVADARAAIEAQGELLRHDEWGTRALAYPIDHKTDAEYHLLQFHASTPELLAGLERSLRIADEIVRFRIVKLKPGTPAAPDMQSAPPAARRTEPEPAAATAAPVAAETETAVETEVEVETVEVAEPA